MVHGGGNCLLKFTLSTLDNCDMRCSFCSERVWPDEDKTDPAIGYLHGSLHHSVQRFSEGSKMITWRCYYCNSNFHKHVWLTADCPRGRLDLRQENNEQNITWLVIRENVSGEDISSKVHSVLLLPTACSDKFGEWYIELWWAHMWDLYSTQEPLFSLHFFHRHIDPFCQSYWKKSSLPCGFVATDTYLDCQAICWLVWDSKWKCPGATANEKWLI